LSSMSSSLRNSTTMGQQAKKVVVEARTRWMQPGAWIVRISEGRAKWYRVPPRTSTKGASCQAYSGEKPWWKRTNSREPPQSAITTQTHLSKSRAAIESWLGPEAKTARPLSRSKRDKARTIKLKTKTFLKTKTGSSHQSRTISISYCLG
jgi:hypothetical protein